MKQSGRDSGRNAAIAFPKKKNRTGSKVLVMVCVAVALVIALLFTPLFNVTQINVTGNERVSAESVIEASGIYLGTNTLKADLRKARAQIETVAFVDSVKVSRRFPGIIDIVVTESSEAAYIPFIGNYVGIDADGKILEIKPKDSPIELPLVLGVTMSEFGIGSIVKTADEEQFELVCQMLRQLEINGITSQIAQIDVTDLSDIRLYLTGNTAVSFGNADNLNYKISFLKSVITSPDMSGQHGGVIDMSNPDRVTYRAGN